MVFFIRDNVLVLLDGVVIGKGFRKNKRLVVRRGLEEEGR